MVSQYKYIEDWGSLFLTIACFPSEYKTPNPPLGYEEKLRLGETFLHEKPNQKIMMNWFYSLHPVDAVSFSAIR